MYAFVLFHFQGLVVILYGDMSSIDEGLDCFKIEITDRHFLSILAYLVSVSAKVFLVMAMWQLSCSRAVPRPYLFVSVLMVTGFFLS